VEQSTRTERIACSDRRLLGGEIFGKIPDEKARYENNVLSYFNDAFSLHELGADGLFEKLGVKRDVFDIALSSLAKKKEKTPAQIHTLLVTANILSNAKLKSSMSNQLRRLLKEPSTARQYEEFEIALMKQSLESSAKRTPGKTLTRRSKALVT
jgi:hypothetical protein